MLEHDDIATATFVYTCGGTLRLNSTRVSTRLCLVPVWGSEISSSSERRRRKTAGGSTHTWTILSPLASRAVMYSSLPAVTGACMIGVVVFERRRQFFRARPFQKQARRGRRREKLQAQKSNNGIAGRDTGSQRNAKGSKFAANEDSADHFNGECVETYLTDGHKGFSQHESGRPILLKRNNGLSRC